MITQDHIFLWRPGKNYYSLAGSSDSSSIFTRCCIFRFPCLFVFTKLSSWKHIQFPDKGYLEQFFAQKDKKVLGTWNYEVAEKMAEDSGTKWWIHCSIKLLVRMRNVSFICIWKPKELLATPVWMWYLLRLGVWWGEK